MELRIDSVDYNPPELDDQLPILLELIREIPGEDRPDYWLAKCKTPIRWLDENIEKEINYVIVGSRWQGTTIKPKVKDLPINISYVVDETVLEDKTLDFNKGKFVAIGIADEIKGGKYKPKKRPIMSGTIGRFFGKGKS